MGITPGAYQHCCRALTPFSMLKKKSNVRYVLAVYWILIDFVTGFSGLGPQINHVFCCLNRYLIY